MTLEEHREHLRRIAAIRDEEPSAAMAALRAGVRQRDVAADLGRGREHIRRIARAAEVEDESGSD